MREEYPDAERALTRALAADPADVQARFYLALTLLCEGKRDEARVQLDDGILRSRYQSDYRYPIEEAESLAAREPEITGGKEMLQALKEASDKKES
jgi:cytochrome c-type biogenesis protein CcmH/NrfG